MTKKNQYQVPCSSRWEHGNEQTRTYWAHGNLGPNKLEHIRNTTYFHCQDIGPMVQTMVGWVGIITNSWLINNIKSKNRQPFGGVIQLFNPKFSPNYVSFIFTKVKCIVTLLGKIIKQYVAIFFSKLCCVINFFLVYG